MASTQAILSAITNMQSNAQGALPVLPNNGNPGGAYNMPHTQQEEQQAPPDPYAWLQPSPFMGVAMQMLEQMTMNNQQRAAQQQPVQPIPEPPTVMPAPPSQPLLQQPPAQPQAMPMTGQQPVLPVWAS